MGKSLNHLKNKLSRNPDSKYKKKDLETLLARNAFSSINHVLKNYFKNSDYCHPAYSELFNKIAMRAINLGAISTLELLIQKGLNKNTQITTKKIPEHISWVDFAVIHKNLDMVKLLIKSGFNIRNDSENSTLCLAISTQQEEIACYLLSMGADPIGRIHFNKMSLSFMNIAILRRMQNFKQKLIESPFAERLVLDSINNACENFSAIILNHDKKAERDNALKTYRALLFNLFDMGIPADLAHEHMENKYHTLCLLEDVAFFNFIGISVNGEPITKKLLKQHKLSGYEKAIFSLADIEQLEDKDRASQLKTNTDAMTQRHGLLMRDEVFNLVPIFYAISSNDIEAARLRLKSGFNCRNIILQYGTQAVESMIAMAEHHKQSELIQEIVDHPTFDKKHLPKMIHNMKPMVKGSTLTMLICSLDANQVDHEGNPPIYHAITKANLSQIKKLVRQGAALNNSYPLGYVLEHAVRTQTASKNPSCYNAIISYLLENGASPDLHQFKERPIEIALQHNLQDTIQQLLPHMDKNYYTYHSFAVCIANSFDNPNWRSLWTNLLNASEQHLGLSKQLLLNHLLQEVANLYVNFKEKLDSNLYLRMNLNDQVSFLLNRDADPNYRFNADNITYLHARLRASAYGLYLQNDVLLQISEAIQHGLDINIQNKTGNSLLHYACWLGLENVVKFLVRLGSNIHQVNKTGDTPLHLACTSTEPSPEIIQYLLQQGADRNIKNKARKTPFDFISDNNEKINKRDLKTITRLFIGPTKPIEKQERINKSLQRYLQSYQNHVVSDELFMKVIIKLWEGSDANKKMSTNDFILVNLYEDPITHQLIKIPVKLNGVTYDYHHLSKLNIDPITKKPFKLSEIEPDKSTAMEIHRNFLMLQEKYHITTQPQKAEDPQVEQDKVIAPPVKVSENGFFSKLYTDYVQPIWDALGYGSNLS